MRHGAAKGGQLLTGLTQTADRRQTGAHEIADRLMIANHLGARWKRGITTLYLMRQSAG
jgi:hypothetical protein